MEDLETDLARRLRDEAASARPFDQFDAVIGDTQLARPAENHRPRSWTVLVAAAAFVVLVGGLVAISRRDPPAPASSTPPDTTSVGADSSSPPVATTTAAVSSTPAFAFVTPQVSLTADEFWIEVGGKRFTSVGASVSVQSDPGDATYQSLELTWNEYDVEMRLYIYFQSDGNQWSSNEFRTYNGLGNADWVTFTGDFFRSPMGMPFSADVFDQTATELGITSRLHFEGIRLQAFVTADPDGSSVPSSSAPPQPIDTTTTFAPSLLSVNVPVVTGQQFLVSFSGRLRESRGGYLFVKDAGGATVAVLRSDGNPNIPLGYELGASSGMLDDGLSGEEATFIFPLELPTGEYTLCTANSGPEECAPITVGTE